MSTSPFTLRRLCLGFYWGLCGIGFLRVLSEGRVDNFVYASSDYWAGWVSLVLLSMPWFLLFGYVLDFFDFYRGGWHFWAFNVADAAINIGVALMILDLLGAGRSRVSRTV